MEFGNVLIPALEFNVVRTPSVSVRTTGVLVFVKMALLETRPTSVSVASLLVSENTFVTPTQIVLEILFANLM